jgi:hypothetical protein
MVEGRVLFKCLSELFHLFLGGFGSPSNGKRISMIMEMKYAVMKSDSSQGLHLAAEIGVVFRLIPQHECSPLGVFST